MQTISLQVVLGFELGGITKHLMTGLFFLFVSPRPQCFKTLRVSGNKIHCFPRGQTLSANYQSSVIASCLWQISHKMLFIFFPVYSI